MLVRYARVDRYARGETGMQELGVCNGNKNGSQAHMDGTGV